MARSKESAGNSKGGSRRAKSSYDAVNAYVQQVADDLIAAMENGTAPWQKPWTPASGGFLPHNGFTGDEYHGANVVELLSKAMTKGYETNIWLTFNQARQLGGHVRKGEHGTACFRFIRDFVRERDEDGKVVTDDMGRPQMKFIMGMKLFTVFNLAQIDGLPEEKVAEMKGANQMPELQWTP